MYELEDYEDEGTEFKQRVDDGSCALEAGQGRTTNQDYTGLLKKQHDENWKAAVDVSSLLDLARTGDAAEGSDSSSDSEDAKEAEGNARALEESSCRSMFSFFNGKKPTTKAPPAVQKQPISTSKAPSQKGRTPSGVGAKAQAVVCTSAQPAAKDGAGVAAVAEESFRKSTSVKTRGRKAETEDKRETTHLDGRVERLRNGIREAMQEFMPIHEKALLCSYVDDEKGSGEGRSSKRS